MRLTKEHIGKKVLSEASEEIFTVISVDEGAAWLKYENGIHSTFDCDYGFKLVEEPKKPSERIKELTIINPLTRICDDQIKGIISYLDEEFEKKK